MKFRSFFLSIVLLSCCTLLSCTPNTSVPEVDTPVPAVPTSTSTAVPDAPTDIPTAVGTDTATPVPDLVVTFTPTSVVTITLPNIIFPNVDEIALFARTFAAEDLPGFFSPVINNGRPDEGIVEGWAQLSAELDLPAPNGTLSELLLEAAPFLVTEGVNYETAVTYSEFDQGTLYQAAPLTNDFLLEIGYAQDDATAIPFLPLPVGILIVYQPFDYLGNELAIDHYLVVADESGLWLLGAATQNIVSGGWLLRGNINLVSNSFSMLTNDRLCYTVLADEICTPFAQPGSAEVDERHAEIIRQAVNELANSEIYIDPQTVNYASALPKLVADQNTRCGEGLSFEIAPECPPNVVMAAINMSPVFENFPVPTGAKDVYPAVAVVAVLENLAGPVLDEAGNLVMELPVGNYRLDIIESESDDETERGLGQLVAADGTRYYVPAMFTDLSSRFIASYGIESEEEALPSDVYLAGYFLRPCTPRNIEPEPAPDCTNPVEERTYICVIYGGCPQYEVH